MPLPAIATIRVLVLIIRRLQHDRPRAGAQHRDEDREGHLVHVVQAAWPECIDLPGEGAIWTGTSRTL